MSCRCSSSRTSIASFTAASGAGAGARNLTVAGRIVLDRNLRIVQSLTRQFKNASRAASEESPMPKAQAQVARPPSQPVRPADERPVAARGREAREAARRDPAGRVARLRREGLPPHHARRHRRAPGRAQDRPLPLFPRQGSDPLRVPPAVAGRARPHPAPGRQAAQPHGAARAHRARARPRDDGHAAGLAAGVRGHRAVRGEAGRHDRRPRPLRARACAGSSRRACAAGSSRRATPRWRCS